MYSFRKGCLIPARTRAAHTHAVRWGELPPFWNSFLKLTTTNAEAASCRGHPPVPWTITAARRRQGARGQGQPAGRQRGAKRVGQQGQEAGGLPREPLPWTRSFCSSENAGSNKALRGHGGIHAPAHATALPSPMAPASLTVSLALSGR